MTINKIILSIDGIRKDRIGCYNYKNAELTPNLTNIAKESLVFHDMFSSATSTVMCFSSIFTGKYSREFKRKDYGDNNNPFNKNLFTDYENLNYSTYVCLNERFKPFYKMINTFGQSKAIWTGFNAQSNSKDEGSLSPMRQVDYVVNKFNNHDKPFLLWLHLWGFSKPKDYFLKKTHFDYDARVAELDEAIGVLFNHFKSNSEILILSDHGYSFFENNKWAYGKDGSNITESVSSVPCIFYNKKIKGDNYNLVSQTNIKRILNNPRESLTISDNIAFCETRYINQFDKSIAIREDKFKFIYNYDTHRSFLYDLQSDPNENINLCSNSFYKTRRNLDGSHSQLKPYVIRNDWDEIEKKIL